MSSTAVSGDGARLVSGSWDAIARLWNAIDGSFIRAFLGHTKAIRSVAFSPKGDRIISGGEDSQIRLWNATNGELLRTFSGHSDTVDLLLFRPMKSAYFLEERIER